MKCLSQARSVTELLQGLIAIPSINPEEATAGENESGNHGEEALARALVPFFKELGYEVQLEEVEAGRPNFIARAPISEGKPRLLFGPHLDTVRVDTMTIDPFAATMKEGKIWGRGASDTKGPMAAMMWGLKEQRALLAEAPVALDFVAFMGEETQQLGSKHFAQHHGSEYCFAVVGEPTSLQIINATKGCLWARLSATGRSGHASDPEAGQNAIWRLVGALRELEQSLCEAFASHAHPLLGSPTINLGTIKGGVSPNVIPDRAEASLDLRTTPSLWKAGGAGCLLKSILREKGLPLEIEELVENPPMEVEEDHPWIAALQAIHPESRCVSAPWFSDAAHLNQAGLPSVCLGPGSIAQAHTKDEFITVKDLEVGARHFSQLTASLAREGSPSFYL